MAALCSPPHGVFPCVSSGTRRRSTHILHVSLYFFFLGGEDEGGASRTAFPIRCLSIFPLSDGAQDLVSLEKKDWGLILIPS